MKIVAFFGSIYGSYLFRSLKAASLDDLNLVAFNGHRALTQPDKVDLALKEADLLFIYEAGEGFSSILAETLMSWPEAIPFVRLGHDAADFGGNVSPLVLAKANLYLTEGGPENGPNFWRFLVALASGSPEKAPSPQKLPRVALWHPAAPRPYYQN
ncbi:MAG: hypothetical protein LBI10_02985, partial [Deltaproteobacteria bacterium]|nr:hypothetical protein [Deltaproteobacteria bacterium]